MRKTRFKLVWSFLSGACLLDALVVLLPRLITVVYSWNRIYEAGSAPAERVAVIFGAV